METWKESFVSYYSTPGLVWFKIILVRKYGYGEKFLTQIGKIINATYSAERYLTSILLPWPRVSKMLTQPCTNLDRHRAPRRAHDPFYNVRRCVHKWNCLEQQAKMWVSAIFELTSEYIGQKLDPPYGAASAAEKRRFINAPSLRRHVPPLLARAHVYSAI